MTAPSAAGFAGLIRGKYRAVPATTPQDIEDAQALRALAFGLTTSHDRDDFDARQQHVLVRERDGGRTVCCYRVGIFQAAGLGQSYAAQFYDLAGLASSSGLTMELGRFCVHPGVQDPDVVRIAWAALTGLVDAQRVGLLFGCTSFAGTDPAKFADVFALLRARHLGPAPWRPGEKALRIVRFAKPVSASLNLRAAMQHMPPLLRTYLLMGGWVSDHAVVDRQMNTLHVFTGLEIAAIPEGRKRLLRGLA